MFCPKCGKFAWRLIGAATDNSIAFKCTNCGYIRKATIKKECDDGKKNQVLKKIDDFITQDPNSQEHEKIANARECTEMPQICIFQEVIV